LEFNKFGGKWFLPRPGRCARSLRNFLRVGKPDTKNDNDKLSLNGNKDNDHLKSCKTIIYFTQRPRHIGPDHL
jgi:hypothetical protein